MIIWINNQQFLKDFSFYLKLVEFDFVLLFDDNKDHNNHNPLFCGLDDNNVNVDDGGDSDNQKQMFILQNVSNFTIQSSKNIFFLYLEHPMCIFPIKFV